MPNTADPLATYRIAENLRECVSERLAMTPQGTPDRSCVTTGAIAWDDCECGQLIVSIQREFFSDSFPSASRIVPGSKRCGPPLMVTEYLISILRCAPTGGDDASPPACSEVDAAAQVAVHDAWAVRWGAHCCLRDWAKSRDQSVSINDFTLEPTVYVGPQGACQGSELRVFVGIINACPPCEE